MMDPTRVCYLCFSENTSFIGKNLDFDTDIYVCNDCGLIQYDFVSSLYLDHYYHQKYREMRKEGINEKYLAFMSRRASSQHNFITKYLPNSVRVITVLDIGASAGKLLETFIPPAEAFAVESDLAMVAHMEKNRSITVLDESVLFSEENRGKFDLVTLSHVFEHINNPLEYLYRLHKIVAEGGYVFMEVPNEPVHLVAYNVKKKKKGIGHLFDYTVETLNMMISKSGLFEVMTQATYSASVADYLKGASINNFDENMRGDGIHIRCLLKKSNFPHQKKTEYSYGYVDAVLQEQYRRQLLSEKKREMVLHGLQVVSETLRRAKTGVKTS